MSTQEDLRNEIAKLEQQLHDAKSLLEDSTPETLSSHPRHHPTLPASSSSHSLFLLADSALPLGSFAYSSGLESFIAHTKPLPPGTTQTTSFHRFLNLSISSIASTILPYLLAAHRHPESLEELDNDLDASTPCTVARRASVAQGRALLSVWERSFRDAYPHGDGEGYEGTATRAMEGFSTTLKQCAWDSTDELQPNGHFAPLWGVVCAAMGIDRHQAAYVFMLNHAKAVLSAAVRASVMGPYQAQKVLASKMLQGQIAKQIEQEWATEPEDAGQVVPVLDLWIGRHELLYSRIFNS
ncbi:hypothetical protein FQN54_008572 [Arachnomyces sp. PD_36]|nr:hypothetical protein FQN54_008572 [Arachnomyces sp. PD_36]